MTTLYVDTVATNTVPGTVEVTLNRFKRDGKEYLELYVKTPTSGRPFQVAFDDILSKEVEARRVQVHRDAIDWANRYLENNSELERENITLHNDGAAILVQFVTDGAEPKVLERFEF